MLKKGALKLLAVLATAGPLSAATYAVDIDSDDGGVDPGDTEPGFQTILLPRNSTGDGFNATVSGVNFEIFGGTAGSRDRGAPDDLNRDFVFKEGAESVATAVRITGLPAGVYNVESWHFDQADVAGLMQVEFRPQGGGSTVLATGVDIKDPAPTTYQITSDGSTVYELVFREASAENRSRFNAIRLVTVPEPGSVVLLGLAWLGLVVRRRR